MADEVSYSVGDNKRKYEESTLSPPPPPRRPTGFSSPIAAVANPSAFELAKQKAQELASRFMNDAEAKRPKFDNGGGFDSAPASVPDHPSMALNFSSNTSSAPTSYGYQATSKKIEIPNTRVGVIIGKGGETIKYLQLQSGAKIQVTRDMDADPNSHTRMVELMGTSDQIAKAEQLIQEVLAEADSGGSAIISKRVTGPAGSEQFSMKIPNNKVGLVIGKGGETIKSIQTRTGARVQVIPLHPPPGDTSNERTVQIDGSSDQIEAAKEIVNEVISEQRMRNTGGYSNQGYQARPPMNWTPPAQTQSGYGYSQPGSYPSQQQYNAPQTQYPGYPPHQSSAGYPSNYWDPSSQQPPSQQTGYDYSHQQQQPPSGGAPPQNNSGYGYNQGYGAQGYSHDGYGGGAYQQPSAQHHAYGQLPPPPPNPNQGYDQSNYGNGSNPPPDGTHAPAATSYGTQQGETGQSQAPALQPSYNSGQQPYGTQTGYAGYPPPQGQKVPAASNLPPYGPPAGQSPQEGGYGQAGGYSSSYSQPPQAAATQPPYGGGAAYTGASAYPPPYGAPASYGQHQAPAANQYGSGSYGNPYPQAASAYAVPDGNTNPEAPGVAQTTNGTEKSSPPELK